LNPNWLGLVTKNLLYLLNIQCSKILDIIGLIDIAL